MRKKVSRFVKNWDTCQKTKPENRNEFSGKITISILFHTWCIDFAGALPRANMSNQYLIVAVEQMSNWPVAWAIPADLFNSKRVMELLKKEIIMLLGPPQYILGDNEPNFDCKAVPDFAHQFNILWKCTSPYNPQGYGEVKRMVSNLRKFLQKVTQRESKEWDAYLKNLLYGYRHRPGPDGVAPFEILFRIKPRFAIELSGIILGE